MNRWVRRIAPLFALTVVTTTLTAQDQRASNDVRADAPPAATAATAATAAPTTAPAAVARDTKPGPTLDRAAAGVRVNRVGPTAPAPEPRRAESKQSDAMMIVGGAGLIVGAIIGDTAGTLLMVGGAVLGLFGLYKYLE